MGVVGLELEVTGGGGVNLNRNHLFLFIFYLPSSNRITHSAESAVTNAGSWQQYTKYP